MSSDVSGWLEMERTNWGLSSTENLLFRISAAQVRVILVLLDEPGLLLGRGGALGGWGRGCGCGLP